MIVNQAVLFTKPVHHLQVDLSPEELNQCACRFFRENGFRFVFSNTVTGPELEARNVIRQHYRMYSAAACAERLQESAAVQKRFENFFHKSWHDEQAAGRIVSMPELLRHRGVDAQQLYIDWLALFDAGKTVKLRDGLIMGFIEEFNAYGINAFYPAMEEIFYHPETCIHYHVVEFDSSSISWKEFRREILGVTNAAQAAPESFRGTFYHDHPVRFPGRDNFVHGSAGPLEGLVERIIHEPGFTLTSNPVGRYLAERGVTLESFSRWRKSQSIEALGALFDETEEKNTDEIVQSLNVIA